MKISSLSVNSFKDVRFWLLALAATQAAVYLTILWKVDDSAHLGMSLLFLAAVVSLVGDKHQMQQLSLSSRPIPTLLGGLILAFVLVQTARFEFNHRLINNDFLRLIPIVSGFGLALVASGFKGLKVYKKELAILFFLGVPSVLVRYIADISPFTAWFSSSMLWYAGFNAYLNETYIILPPENAVNVYEGCSGIESMNYVLGLSIVSLAMFPLSSRLLSLVVPFIGIAIGFVVNAFRVCLLTLISNPENKAAFDYWHEGTGSLIFGLIAVVVYGAFYYLLLQIEERKNKNLSAES